jgi:ABC-type transport system involved in multi-copper enzyme maturation permease subunit
MMSKPLIWKEWREQRWKTVFGTVMALAFLGATTAARVMTAREAVALVWAFIILLLPLYSAMGVFAPERSAGTLHFLASRPFKPFQVFFWKWLFGWLNVAIPLLACSLLALLLDYRRIVFPDDLWPFLWCLWAATVFYTAICCLAPIAASEAQVGLFGLAILLAAVLHSRLSIMMNWMRNDWKIGMRVFDSLNPAVIFRDILPGSRQADRLAIAIVLQLAVGVLILLAGYRKWRRSL